MAKNQYTIPGRPTKMTDPALDKLEQAFAMGCTDTEACLFANLHPATLYKYQKQHPEFVERKRVLKEMPVLKARKTIENSLEEDQNTAKWYLERKKRDEFGPEQKIDLKGKLTIEEAINQLDE